MTMSLKKRPRSKKDKLKEFLKQPSKPKRDLVLNSGKEILELIDSFLQSYTDGKTTKSMPEFHSFLKKECGAEFSCDTLKRYCKKHKPKLWNAYTEVRDGKSA